MTRDEIRAKMDEIERGVMWDQPRWKQRLDAATDQNREAALKILLEPADFEQWHVLKTMLT
jgi:hypothetical protein